MSARARILAEQFTTTNNAVIAFVEGCDDDLWHAPAHGEGRPVNVVAHHIAAGGSVYPPLLTAILHGAPLNGFLAGTDGDPAAAWDAVHAYNAAQDAATRECTRDQVLTVLREQGEVLAAFIAALTDDDLDRPVVIPYRPTPVPGQELIERMPIGHPRSHLAALEATRAARQGGPGPTTR